MNSIEAYPVPDLLVQSGIPGSNQEEQETAPRHAPPIDLAADPVVYAGLPLEDAVRVKSAELWLKLGEADEALRELERLPSRSWDHVWALKTRILALAVLG